MSQITRAYTFQEGTVGYAAQVNTELNQLVAAVNAADTTLTGLSTPTGGAPTVGSAALTDLGQVAPSTVRDQLVLIAAGIAARYTSAQIDSLLNSINTNAVKTITFNEADGVFTITKINGTITTIDTTIEKIPVSVTLETRDSDVYLVILNEDGTKSEANVTSLLNVYTATDTDTIDTTIAGYAISAALKSGSVMLTHLNSEVMAAIISAQSICEASAISSSGAATMATTKATEAANSATAAAASSTSASGYATAAQGFAGAALTSQSWAVGDTGGRAGEDTNNSKYWCNRAEAIAGDGVMLKPDYDTNDDGVVNDSDKLGGQLPAYYTNPAIVNDLTETVAGKVLDARQGKALAEDIAETNTDLSNLSILLSNYNSYASGIDAKGVYTIVQYKRADATLYLKSTLSGGTSPNYTTDTWQFYDAAGTTVISTNTWTLTYDASGKITSKVVA